MLAGHQFWENEQTCSKRFWRGFERKAIKMSRNIFLHVILATAVTTKASSVLKIEAIFKKEDHLQCAGPASSIQFYVPVWNPN